MLWLVLGCVQRAERLDRPEELLARLEAGEGPPVEAPVLGPAGRELRALGLQQQERPEEAFEGLGGFDPGGVDAAWRFAEGDPSTRLLLAEALRRELQRPTLEASSAWVGLGSRGQRLEQAARAGLGQDPASADALLEAEDGWDLLELLEAEPDPFGETAMLELLEPSEPPPLSEAWEGRAQSWSQPELVRQAAHWLPRDEPKALLGLVASPLHAYGEGPFSVGQRGEPADVLRYGGGSPGATAVAASLLAEEAGVELQLDTDGRRLRLSSGGLAAWVDACGPGAAPSPERRLRPLELQEALDLALAERVAGAMEAGELERAMALSRGFDEEVPEVYARVHGALLACQGVRWPGLRPDDADLALAWAQACPEGDEAGLLAEFGGLKPYDGRGIEACSRPWSPVPRRLLEAEGDSEQPTD